MLGDLSNKQKLVLLVILILAVGPTWALSGMGMTYFVNKAKENDGKDPKSPERLYFLAKVYDMTYRPEPCREILKDWIVRYGGDDSERPENERYITWEPYPWSDENPRPAHYNKTPHPLTGQVLCHWAEMFEKERNYPASKHLFEVALKYFDKDQEAKRRATAGLLRDKSRSF